MTALRRSAPAIGILALCMSAASCLNLLAPGPGSCLTDTYLGTFYGRASGVASDTLAGCAYFAVSVAEESEMFGLILTNGGPRDVGRMIKILRNRAMPPEEGTHLIGSAQDGALYGLILLDERPFTLTSGAVTITESDDFNLTGSVDVVGTDLGGRTISIRGSFVAECSANKGVSIEDNDGNQYPDKTTFCRPGTARSVGGHR